MAIETKKFSEFLDAGDIANDATTVGLSAGTNAYFNNPWTFLPPGDTASRPAPSSAINYRLRFNTEDQVYEFYDAVLAVWTQLADSEFVTGPFVIYEADASLPDAQNLGALANGLLKQTISSGSATLDIAVLNTDYYGPGMNPLPSDEGGTGVDNGASTITLGGSLSTIGAFTSSFTMTGNTSVTFPTSGTLATTSGSGRPTVTIAGTTQAANVNTNYITLNAAQTAVTLPATFAVGDIIAIIGSTTNTGGWIIGASAGDTILFNGVLTSSGGTLTSSALAGQCVVLMCDVADSSWVVVDTVSTTLTTA